MPFNRSNRILRRRRRGASPRAFSAAALWQGVRIPRTVGAQTSDWRHRRTDKPRQDWIPPDSALASVRGSSWAAISRVHIEKGNGSARGRTAVGDREARVKVPYLHGRCRTPDGHAAPSMARRTTPRRRRRASFAICRAAIARGPHDGRHALAKLGRSQRTTTSFRAVRAVARHPTPRESQKRFLPTSSESGRR